MIFLQMILLTIGIICLQKPRYSLGYFVVCRILIPENFRILNGVISLNTLNILFCVISILLYGFKHHIYIEKFSKKFIMRYAAKRSGNGVTPLSLRLIFVFCDYLL